jgi:putative ABC transport system permease protein
LLYNLLPNSIYFDLQSASIHPMFITYLKSAWRNLISHKLFSAINIVGLGFGLAICMLIILYYQHENSYDKFHTNGKRIAWLRSISKWGNESYTSPMMSYATGSLCKQYIPGVASVLRTMKEYQAPVIQAADKPDLKYAEENFNFTDSNFFQFFSFKLSLGSPADVLQKPFSLVITTSIAKKYFGNLNPIGKQIIFNGKYRFTVTGIAEPPPSNSSIQYDFIASMSSISSMDKIKEFVVDPLFHAGIFYTYLFLKQDINVSALEKELANLQMHLTPELKAPDVFVITPLEKIHLSPEQQDQGNLKYLSLFQLVAGLILLLALTNYVSLSTARASLRAKEVGVRKVLGANRKSVAWQFFTESALYTSLAFILGYNLCLIFRERFFGYLQLPVDNSYVYAPTLLFYFFLLFLFTVLFASIYPSILMSGFKPVAVLYGKFSKNSGGLKLRKLITVFQFCISVSLIICGIVINRQVSFFRNTYTGVNRDNVIMIPFPANMGKSYPVLRSEIGSISGVQQIAVDHYKMYHGNDGYFARSKENSNGVNLSVLNVDRQFSKLLELQWAVLPEDQDYYLKEKQVVLNETAVKELNLKPGILHQEITIYNDEKLELAGIVKDFNYSSLENKVGALGLFVASDTSSIWSDINGTMLVKINAHVNLPTLITKMKRIYEKYEKTTPFSYSFLDNDFEALYVIEERLSQIFLILILVTISIAALGLFGLVTFMTGQRTKEIGIRKVLGASVIQIVQMLTKDFVGLVILAWIIACPIAWFCMSKWLELFAYRIHLQWWMLAIGGGSAIMIALATMGFQSFRSAAANPANSLRS